MFVFIFKMLIFDLKTQIRTGKSHLKSKKE